MSPEQPALPTDTLAIADVKFRAGVLILRWLLLLLYFVFVETGVLAVSDRDLLWSGAFIFLYDCFHVWLFFQGDQDERWFNITRHVDILTVTSVLVSLHDMRSPVWAIYFISIVSIAHMISRREMIGYVAWVTLNYAGAAAITAARGYDVPWPYVIVVSMLLQFMGYSAGLLAGGEERLRAVIAHAAATDSLTGLPNRHAFHATYSTMIARALEERTPLALMVLDVDHFKQINDTHGHPAGDDKLRDVAKALASVVRGTDLVARYGGDEFIVMAPATTRAVGLGLAERMRAAVSECDARLSIGVALFPEDADDETALIEAADKALYRAKQAGRNCVRDLAA